MAKRSSSLDIKFTPTSIPATTADAVVERTNIYIRLLTPGRRLDTLRISFHPVQFRHLQHVRKWLDYAASCGVAVVRLDISLAPNRYGKPPFFYLDWTAPSVADLTLCGGFELWVPPSHFKQFTSLEVLTLHEISISDKELASMATDIALLRVLDIRRCPDLRDVFLPGPRMHRLTFVGCPKARTLTVACPNLRYFHFSGEILCHYAMNSPVLEDVYMSSCGGGGGPGAGLPQTNLANIFQWPFIVEILTLCSLSLQCITAVPAREFLMFWNLTELQLKMVTMASSNLMDIHSFSRLCKCPFLEKLFIELPTCTHEPDASTEICFEERPPEGGFQSLKTIKIINFKGHEIEMRLVSILLGQAASLDSLIIVAPPLELTGEGYDEVWSALANFDRLMLLRMDVSMLVREASPGAELTMTQCDDRRLLPTHSEAYHHKTREKEEKKPEVQWKWQQEHSHHSNASLDALRPMGSAKNRNEASVCTDRKD